MKDWAPCKRVPPVGAAVVNIYNDGEVYWRGLVGSHEWVNFSTLKIHITVMRHSGDGMWWEEDGEPHLPNTDEISFNYIWPHGTIRWMRAVVG